MREIFLKYITHFPALVNRVHWRVFNLFLMSHHYKHQPRWYLGVVSWCHQEPVQTCRAWLAFHRLTLFSLMVCTAVCSVGEAVGGHCGIWELLPPSILPDAWLYLNSFRRSLCCAHDTKCVPVQYGGSVCVSGCRVLPTPPLLTCFLRLLLVTSYSLMETSRATLKFPWGSRKHSVTYASGWLCVWGGEGACGFWPLFSGGSEPAAFSSTPPCVTDVSEGQCHWSLITNNWLLLYMKTQYLWQLNSNQ